MLTRDVGKSLSFNGTSDFMRVSNVVPSTTNFNLATWMYMPIVEADFDKMIDCQGTGGSGGFVFQTNTNKRFNLTVRNLTVADANISCPATYGSWFHVAFTFTTNSCVLYINGVSVGTDTSCTMTATDQLITLARNSVASSGFVKAYFADFIYANTAPWTSAEVLDIYLRDLYPATLTVRYNFNDNVTDQTGNGNNGTLTGTTYSTFVPIKPRASIASARPLATGRILV